MQTYSVSEIAKALGTDLVTVRRWIAKGALIGKLDTRKGGYYVDKADLNAFLETHPKYARLAAHAGLLDREAATTVGMAAINRALEKIGSMPASEAAKYLDKEIDDARQELDETEQKLDFIKENITALTALRNLLTHGEALLPLGEAASKYRQAFDNAFRKEKE